MIDVTVVLVEGGMPSTAVAPVEIFSSVGVLWNSMRREAPNPRFRVRTASLGGVRPLATAVCLNIEPDCSVDEVESSDVIIVAAAGADIGRIQAANAGLGPRLREWHARGATIAGVCSGVVVLADAGLLDGCQATTHWGIVDDCRRQYPQVHWQPERFLTESGRVLCSGGVYAAVDLSLYLVEKFCGHRLAMETARALLLETPRTWQVGYAAEPPEVSHDDVQIRSVQEWLFRNFTSAVRVEALAALASMTPRTFARRFKMATGQTPLNYLHRLRINAAKHLLENDSRTVQQVGRFVGYDDLAFFRGLFRRFTGTSPQKYRERFGARPMRSLAAGARAPHP